MTTYECRQEIWGSSFSSVSWNLVHFISHISHLHWLLKEFFMLKNIIIIIFIYLFFYFTILYWFCHTSTCICHGCTHVPHPEPPSHLPPLTIPLGHPSARAPSFLYPASNLDCHSPKSFPPSLSHRVQKTVLYICVSFAVSHTGLSLPSF